MDEQHFYTSIDGLRLHYRDYSALQAGTPVLCLPGLTRNSRDFEDLAAYLAPRRRALCPDFRGRGYSDYDREWKNYHPLTYVEDVWTLLDSIDVERVIVIGTSLGGLCAMAMAVTQNDRIAGAILNDIGPEINPAGVARVQEYTGRLPPVANWDEAVSQSKAIYGDSLPGLSGEFWARFVRRAFREDEHGVPRLDMDDNIGRAVREVGPQSGDPWQFFEQLGGRPVTVLHGESSDILTTEICDKMQARMPALNVVTVANRGHVPLLDEPECLAAIDAMLDEVQ